MTYATVAEFLAWTGRTSASSAEQTTLGILLDAASAAIDEHCFRSFTSASSASARTFSVRAGAHALIVDDFTALTSVTVDGSLVSGTVLAPVSPGRPYTTILPGVPGTRWGVSSDAVAVVATWGWETTPSAVKIACLLLAAKVSARRQSPSGIERGNDAEGFVRILGTDADTREMLRPLRRVGRSFA